MCSKKNSVPFNGTKEQEEALKQTKNFSDEIIIDILIFNHSVIS